jgi:hypothetical protein
VTIIKRQQLNGGFMQYKENDLIKLTGQGETLFKVVMASQSGNLMLVRHNTNELWSAHVEDIAETN